MKAYIDSSIVLRLVLGEPNALQMPTGLKELLASDILKVECFRTLDRMRVALQISDKDISERSALLHQELHSIRFAKLDSAVLQRACDPFTTALRALDAIHLSTAILIRQHSKDELLFMTHDEQLARAARATNFSAVGV